ncbi:hypothetical protein [Streptomyces xylophagus]|uniref:hypothetical protein n=1 Tax=Streptomyces xylophagus TaxID=285514 RepID=UPI0005B8E18C|nr:hypothetical protein [Streptomyces xylophagus]
MAATPAPAVEVFERDLDALLRVVKGELATKKDETRAARGRLRQVARRHRHQRYQKVAGTVCEIAPRVLVYALALAGFTAFGTALALLVIGGTTDVALTLFTVAAAAWGMGAALHR